MVAEAAGFQKYETRDNKLDPSADLVIDATLTWVHQPNDRGLGIDRAVADGMATVQTGHREQIDALELNGRNPVS